VLRLLLAIGLRSGLLGNSKTDASKQRRHDPQCAMHDLLRRFGLLD